MGRQSISLFVLAVVFAARLPLARADDAREAFQERWKPALLPEKLPQTGELLSGVSWVQRHPRTILGVGVDYKIRFPPPSDREGPELHFTSISFPSVNARETGVTETTRKLPLLVYGPLLQFDGLVQTAYVVKNERLILGAAVRVDDGKWYQLSSRKTDKKSGRKSQVEITEHLFAFESDPLKEEEGKLTVQWHRRKLEDKEGDRRSLPTTFRLERRKNDDNKTRRLKLLADVVDGVRHNLPDVFFFEDPNYALLEDRGSDFPNGIFEAEKKSPE